MSSVTTIAPYTCRFLTGQTGDCNSRHNIMPFTVNLFYLVKAWQNKNTMKEYKLQTVLTQTSSDL